MLFDLRSKKSVVVHLKRTINLRKVCEFITNERFLTFQYLLSNLSFSVHNSDATYASILELSIIEDKFVIRSYDPSKQWSK